MISPVILLLILSVVKCGLTAVLSIIDHGGAVSVSTRLGRGTVFTVLLPKIISEKEETVIAQESLSNVTEHILFVDDEALLVASTKWILEKLGYKVTPMTSSRESLDLFRKNPEAYDLVITDLTMPQLSGDRFAAEIIAIRPDIPVIISTGYADALDDDKMKISGIKAFIPKPYQRQELARIVRLVLDGN